MVFVKENDQSLSDLNLSNKETKKNLKISKLLREFQDIFTNDIPAEMPPSRGMNDHSIDLIPRITPPNKPPYQVSKVQQEQLCNKLTNL